MAHIPSFYPRGGGKIELIFALQAAFSKIWANFQNSHIWAWNLASGQHSRSCTYTLFLPHGGQIERIFNLRAAVSWDTGQFSKLQNLPSDQSSISCTYTLLLLPRGRNWAYFCSTGSGFRVTGPFSKLPYLGMKLGHWPKCQKLHIYSFSTPGGQNWAYFHSTGSGF